MENFNLVYSVGLAISIFVVSFLLTAAVRQFALSKDILDIPNERSSHRVPTPRGGGVAIIISVLLALWILFAKNAIDWPMVVAFGGGGLVIAVIGYWDDVQEVSARWRILIHLFAAIWAVYWLGGFNHVDFGIGVVHWGWIGNVIGVISVMWLTNLYNFMDGIDGFAGSEAVFVGVVAGIILYLAGVHAYAYVAWIIAAACLGFTFWNWPPAKIFMGDVGSGTLGYWFALVLGGSANTGKISPFIMMILLCLFIFDATYTLIRRLLHGEPFYLPHRSHAFQILTQKYGNHLSVTGGAVLINILILMPLAFIAWYWQKAAFLIFFIIFLISIGVWLRINRMRKE